MFVSKILLANFFVSLAGVIFIMSLLPQIHLNYKIKSTKGLSDIFILASLNGQFSYLVYALIRDLPFIYKVINPIYAFFLSVIIFQRFFYSDGTIQDRYILRIYLFNILVLIFVAYFIFTGATRLGYLLGWIPVGIGLWKKVPQMFKVYRAKSVYGFSLFFIILSLVSYTLESSASLILGLPTPVLLNNFRGFFVNFVFLFQFWIYKEI